MVYYILTSKIMLLTCANHKVGSLPTSSCIFTSILLCAAELVGSPTKAQQRRGHHFMEKYAVHCSATRFTIPRGKNFP